ncbi:hypothetical protein CC79DRAFT_490937 [Sarocladium strictum]
MAQRRRRSCGGAIAGASSNRARLGYPVDEASTLRKFFIDGAWSSCLGTISSVRRGASSSIHGVSFLNYGRDTHCRALDRGASTTRGRTSAVAVPIAHRTGDLSALMEARPRREEKLRPSSSVLHHASGNFNKQCCPAIQLGLDLGKSTGLVTQVE